MEIHKWGDGRLHAVEEGFERVQWMVLNLDVKRGLLEDVMAQQEIGGQNRKRRDAAPKAS